MKRQTSKIRRHSRSQVLEVRVMSPRIAWFECLKFVKSIGKTAVIIALLGGIGWGIWLGVQKALYKNPEFSLQTIDLNPNPVVDEAALIERTGISLPANLFEINVGGITEKLKSLPGISDAHVERHLPGTLVVRVTARTPKAWLSIAGSGNTNLRKTGDLLVDHSGTAYPCPALQQEAAAKLPIIQISAPSKPIVAGTPIEQPDLELCLRLLDAACENDPLAVESIESIRKANDWSLSLVTREGTVATFGLADHARQIANLRAALDHAGRKGYLIKTINLIPKQNVPITISEETAVPAAPVAPPEVAPVSAPTPEQLRQDRRAKDRNALLNRG